MVQDCICCSRRSFDSAPFHSHNKYLHNNLTTCESNLANSKFIVLIILNTYNIQLTHIPHIMVTAPMTFYHRVNYKSNNSFSFNIHILNFLAGFHFSVRPIQMIQNVNAPKEHSMNHHLLFRVSNSEIYTVYSSRNAYIYFLRMCVKCYTINKTKPKRKKPGDFRVNSLQIYIWLVWQFINNFVEFHYNAYVLRSRASWILNWREWKREHNCVSFNQFHRINVDIFRSVQVWTQHQIFMFEMKLCCRFRAFA